MDLQRINLCGLSDIHLSVLGLSWGINRVPLALALPCLECSAWTWAALETAPLATTSGSISHNCCDIDVAFRSCKMYEPNMALPRTPRPCISFLWARIPHKLRASSGIRGPDFWAFKRSRVWTLHCLADKVYLSLVTTGSMFSTNTYKRHSIARLWGRAMECLLWYKIWPSFYLYRFNRSHVSLYKCLATNEIFNHEIT